MCAKDSFFLAHHWDRGLRLTQSCWHRCKSSWVQSNVFLEDRGSKFLRKYGLYVPKYTVSYCRKLEFLYVGLLDYWIVLS